MKKISVFLESIKFSHTLFAMPFALIATLLASRGVLPAPRTLLWIVLAMVGARTWAMVVNRLVDAAIDAKNPRTAQRAVPAGQISRLQMGAWGAAGAALFVVAAYQLSYLAFLCAFPVLAILASYTWTKRFTWLCHFWLGLCLGLAPLGAWVALRGEFPWELLTLSFGILFWVAGFDIIYALQDREFDAQEGLNSVPARFGLHKALWTARVSHLCAGVMFVVFGVHFNLGILYFVGVSVSIFLMVYEHFLVKKGDLSKIDMAFFNLNGWIAVLLLSATAVSLALQGLDMQHWRLLPPLTDWWGHS